MAIPITKPDFGDEEWRAVQEPLKSGWVVQGPWVRRFEEQFCDFTAAPFAVATSSCTAALHVAVAALGLRPGDEVIVPAFTWVSTANVVEYLGATPVFCDIDLRTFNLDPNHLEAVITPRTVGLIPVHLFGLCADMEPILRIARARALWVVEDAACALGAFYDNRHAGTFGEVGCFSFHPRKTITTGEGGMLTTGRQAVDRLARILRDHGASRSDLDRHTGQAGLLLPAYDHLGYNYRMTDLQAALGCVQLGRAAHFLQARTRWARRYDEVLAGLDWLERPAVPERCRHGYQAYACLFRPEQPTLANVERLHRQRNAIMQWLNERGIATRQGTHAPVLLGYYAAKYGVRPEQFPQAVLADRLSLALPLYPQLTDDEVQAVGRGLREAMDAQVAPRALG